MHSSPLTFDHTGKRKVKRMRHYQGSTVGMPFEKPNARQRAPVNIIFADVSRPTSRNLADTLLYKDGPLR